MFATTLLGLSAVLLLTGIIGGGFEIKEAKVPKVGPKSRAGAVVAGIVCLLLALEVHDPQEGEEVAGADEESEPVPEDDLSDDGAEEGAPDELGGEVPDEALLEDSVDGELHPEGFADDGHLDGEEPADDEGLHQEGHPDDGHFVDDGTLPEEGAEDFGEAPHPADRHVEGALF